MPDGGSGGEQKWRDEVADEEKRGRPAPKKPKGYACKACSKTADRPQDLCHPKPIE